MYNPSGNANPNSNPNPNSTQFDFAKSKKFNQVTNAKAAQAAKPVNFSHSLSPQIRRKQSASIYITEKEDKFTFELNKVEVNDNKIQLNALYSPLKKKNSESEGLFNPSKKRSSESEGLFASTKPKVINGDFERTESLFSPVKKKTVVETHERIESLFNPTKKKSIEVIFNNNGNEDSPITKKKSLEIIPNKLPYLNLNNGTSSVKNGRMNK